MPIHEESNEEDLVAAFHEANDFLEGMSDGAQPWPFGKSADDLIAEAKEWRMRKKGLID